MGFGYVFVGYLLTFNFVSFEAYTDIFAVLLMCLGLSSLSRYAKGFKQAFTAAFPLLALCAVTFVGQVGDLIGFWALSPFFTTYTAMVGALLKGVFLWLLLGGVFQIAGETGIPVLQQKAWRNRIFTLLFFGLGMLLESNVFPAFSWVVWTLMIVYLFFGLIYTFFNAKLFYECYIWICLEGEESMERKPSRFALFNKLQDFSDRMDERTLERKKAEREEKEAHRKEKESFKKRKRK